MCMYMYSAARVQQRHPQPVNTGLTWRATFPAVLVRGECSFGARRGSLLAQLGPDRDRGRHALLLLVGTYIGF